VWQIAKSFVVLSLASVGAVAPGIRAQERIPFDSPRWNRVDSEITEVGGRRALQGSAILRDADFADGVIEYDLYITGARSYPGVYFRLSDDDNAEHFYVRPHRAGLYPDALQYAPVVRGIGEWQLYAGEGYSAAGTFTRDAWIPVRLEVRGGQARVFVEDLETPALVIPHLESGETRGGLALTGPRDGSAYFSNFRYATDLHLDFPEPTPREPAANMIRRWQVSEAYPAARVQRSAYPGFYAIFGADWQPLEADARGLVDVARRTGRRNPEGDLVLARHVFYADEDREMTLSVGYSDEADLFFNGGRVWSGQSRYQQRDPSFLGIVGLFDQISVPVHRGLNEVFLMVTEVFGGWGFMVQADAPLRPKPTDHARTREMWATSDTFLTPESVLKDPSREVLYVSNFDNQYASREEPSGYISRLGMDGEILELQWVSGLHAPTGMDIRHDTLWVAERTHLLAIDIASGAVAGRWPIPDPVFPNDLIIDQAGTVYISDTRTGDWADSRIYRFRNGAFDVLANEGISRANGLWIRDGQLLVGSSGDGLVKRVDLESGRISTVISLGAGLIDGMRALEDGSLLVSHWEGQLYHISPAGEIVEILDARPQGWNVADFEYLPEEGLLLVPTFLDNRVRAVRVLP